MVRMRKIVSIIFVGLFLLNSFGYYFIFTLNQRIIKDEMRTLIRKGFFREHYEQLAISTPSANPDFKWCGDREFRYNGKMYDLISMDITGTSVIFNCINDTKEDQIIAQHDQFRNALTGLNSPEKAKNTIAMQNLVITQALLRYHILQAPTSTKTVFFHEPLISFHSIVLNPSYPPPRST